MWRVVVVEISWLFNVGAEITQSQLPCRRLPYARDVTTKLAYWCGWVGWRPLWAGFCYLFLSIILFFNIDGSIDHELPSSISGIVQHPVLDVGACQPCLRPGVHSRSRYKQNIKTVL